MIQLPVSGWRVWVDALTGRTESLLLGTKHLSDPESLAALLPELARKDGPVEWSKIPVTDADYLLLQVRRAVFGETVASVATCTDVGCGARMDLSFDVDLYLDHHAPRRSKLAEAIGSMRWRIGDVVFRAPTLKDEIAAADSKDASAYLLGVCIEGVVPNSKIRAQVEAELDRVAPSMQGELGAKCPACQSNLRLVFDPRAFVLRELRDQASFMDDDIHLLASTYAWSYGEIIDLPVSRRLQFAERIRQDRYGGGV